MRLVLNIVLALVLGLIALMLYLANQGSATSAGSAQAPAPLNPVPLTRSQQIRLETATDNLPTVDEAAFYALLENAAQWNAPGRSEEDLLIPNMKRILANPAAYRGKLCVIEGKLEAARPVDVSFEKWKDTRVWYLRMSDGEADPAKLYTNTLVPVYLSTPLPLPMTRTPEGQYIISRSDYGRTVRVIARFFKVLEDRPLGATTPTQVRQYPVFVGHTAQFVAAGSRSEKPGPTVFILVMLGAIGGYIVLRFLLARKVATQPSRIDALREQRARRLAALGEEEPEDQTPDLPEDPVDAMDLLDRQAKENDSHGPR